jgi:hypothetical protein
MWSADFYCPCSTSQFYVTKKVTAKNKKGAPSYTGVSKFDGSISPDNQGITKLVKSTKRAHTEFMR